MSNFKLTERLLNKEFAIKGAFENKPFLSSAYNTLIIEVVAGFAYP